MCTTLLDGKMTFFFWAQDHSSSQLNLFSISSENWIVSSRIMLLVISLVNTEKNVLFWEGTIRAVASSCICLTRTRLFLSYLLNYTADRNTWVPDFFTHPRRNPPTVFAEILGLRSSPVYIRILRPATWWREWCGISLLPSWVGSVIYIKKI